MNGERHTCRVRGSAVITVLPWCIILLGLLFALFDLNLSSITAAFSTLERTQALNIAEAGAHTALAALNGGQSLESLNHPILFAQGTFRVEALESGSATATLLALGSVPRGTRAPATARIRVRLARPGPAEAFTIVHWERLR